MLRISPSISSPLAVALLAATLVTACSDDDPADGGGGQGAGGEPVGGQGGGASGGGGAGAGGAGGGDEVERCLFVNACQADGGAAVGMEACLGHFYERQWHWASSGEYRLAMEAMDCRLAASDCEGVRACDAAPSDFDAECAENIGGSICVDDTWVLCDFKGAASSAFDCSAAGQSCNVDIWAGCGTEPCTFGTTMNSCDPEDPTALVVCAPSGFLERVDCARENNFVLVHAKDGDIPATIAGEVCGDDPMLGSKGCIGQGDACDFFSQECEGEALVTCAGGSLSRRDCAAQQPAGQSCGFQTEGPFAGGAACGVVESSCSPGDEACDGGSISFCAQGRAQTVDCVAAGFAGCAAQSNAGRSIAFCTAR